MAVAGESGRHGILVQRHGPARHRGTWAWGLGTRGRPFLVRLAGPGVLRADRDGAGGLLLTDRAGRVRRFDRAFRPVGRPVHAVGRLATPLVRATRDGTELVVDLSGGRVTGGRPSARTVFRDRWEVDGRLPALVRGPAGEEVVAVAIEDAEGSALALYAGTGHATTLHNVTRLRAPLDHAPVPVPDGRLVLTLRTGTHTLATEVRRFDGTLDWENATAGAYLHPPAVGAEPHGRPVVVFDDHGWLHRHDADGSHLGRTNWTAAYTLPILGAFGPRGRWAILRASGIHGVELLTASGRRIWRREMPLWHLFAGRAAVGVPGDDRRPVVALPTRGRTLDALDTATGETRWVFDLGTVPESASVVAADVDGDGRDEFLVGLPDGRLLAVGETPFGPAARWEVQFSALAGNPIVADLDGDGVGEIIVATADGFVHVLAVQPGTTRRL